MVRLQVYLEDGKMYPAVITAFRVEVSGAFRWVEGGSVTLCSSRLALPWSRSWATSTNRLCGVPPPPFQARARPLSLTALCPQQETPLEYLERMPEEVAEGAVPHVLPHPLPCSEPRLQPS